MSTIPGRSGYRKIAKKLEKLLDVRVAGFDPSFLLVFEEREITIPLWLALKIIELKKTK